MIIKLLVFDDIDIVAILASQSVGLVFIFINAITSRVPSNLQCIRETTSRETIKLTVTSHALLLFEDDNVKILEDRVTPYRDIYLKFY